MIASDKPSSVPGAELRLAGIPASPGVVSGRLAIFSHEEVRVRPTPIEESQIPDELRRLEAALLKTREQIQGLRITLPVRLGKGRRRSLRRIF